MCVWNGWSKHSGAALGRKRGRLERHAWQAEGQHLQGDHPSASLLPCSPVPQVTGRGSKGDVFME